HPFVPFVTSELYAALGHEEQAAVASWPQFEASLVDDEAEADFDRLRAAVSAARNLRAEAEIPPSKVIDLEVSGPGATSLLGQRELFDALARARLVAVAVPTSGQAEPASSQPEGASDATLSRPLPEMELRLPLAGQVDLAAYEANQRARLARVEAE